MGTHPKLPGCVVQIVEPQEGDLTFSPFATGFSATFDPFPGSPAVVADVAGLFGPPTGLGFVAIGFEGSPGAPAHLKSASVNVQSD